MVDPSLIAAVRKGDKGAFKPLYQSCIRYVYYIVRRYVTNESDHPDVIQEIFARVFLSIQNFDSEKGAFKFWLRRLVINQCLQHYRKPAGHSKIVPLESVSEPKSDTDEPFKNLTKSQIEQYLSKMPDGYRQIFMLVVIDEYSHKEVSELLDITAETSRSQLHRAKRWLRKYISNNPYKLLASGL